MKPSSVISSVALAMGLAVVCSCNGPANPKGADGVYCEHHCEAHEFFKRPNGLKETDPNWKPFKLHPGEADSLAKAVNGIKDSKSGSGVHLHAEAVQGNLVFRSDDDSTHIAGVESSIVLGDAKNGQQSEKIAFIASPEAVALLQKRTEG